MEINKEVMKKYSVRENQVPTTPGCWNKNLIEIFQEDKKIGEYERNYPSLYNTFVPFTQKGKEYALYSKDYTATRVMSLPDCKDLCGEESEGGGFCPTGYAVPYDLDAGLDGQFGFVAGCRWGDDSGGWKIEYLDLSKIEEGIFKRDDRLGYIELPFNAERLAEAIDLYSWEPDHQHISIACLQYFNLTKYVKPADELFKDAARDLKDIKKYAFPRLTEEQKKVLATFLTT